MLDFIQTAGILDPSMFAFDLINNNSPKPSTKTVLKFLNALLSVQFNGPKKCYDFNQLILAIGVMFSFYSIHFLIKKIFGTEKFG